MQQKVRLKQVKHATLPGYTYYNEFHSLCLVKILLAGIRHILIPTLANILL